jgi:hypothetical protein
MKSGTMPSSFVTELHKQGYIAKPIATVQMGNPFGDEKYIGQFVIGDVIANMTQHDFTKHKNNDARQNRIWQLELDQFQINGKQQTSVTKFAAVDPSALMSIPYLDWPLYTSSFI